MRSDAFFADLFRTARARALLRSAVQVRDQLRGQTRDELRGRLVEQIRGLVGGAPAAAASAVLFGFGLAGASAATTGSPDVAASPDAAIVASGRAGAVPGADRAARNDVPAPPVNQPDWMSPMPDAETTSCFGPRWGTMHAGVDLAQPENAPIFAAGAGTVIAEGWLYAGYGISVVIDHGGGTLTHYAHLNKTNVVAGDQVMAGHLIGWEGSTGDSTGPHLHFEVHQGMWNQVDPGPWMKEHGVDLKC